MVFCLVVISLTACTPVSETVVTPAPVTASPAPTLARTAPPKKSGYIQYVNEELKYGFSYPQTEQLSKCADSHCLSIDRIGLVVEFLSAEEISGNDRLASLTYSDLMCAASGPNASIDCKNQSAVDFTNELGFKGYKVTRTKEIVGKISSAGIYTDSVYVYLLPEVVKGPGLTDYAAVFFTVTRPDKANLKSLESIAQTAFTL